jgi:hypothetical protein
MKRASLWLALLGATLGLACATPAPEVTAFNVYVPSPPKSHDEHWRGAHHDMPAQCTSGCDIEPPEVRKGMTREEAAEAVAEIALHPVGHQSDALDLLLFHAYDARTYLEEAGWAKLSAAHRVWLTRELNRDHAIFEMRLVDENGVTRAWKSLEVPLSQKQHIELEHEKLPGLVASGTVVRVGTEHLWTRF